jgi:hypothetical protein
MKIANQLLIGAFYFALTNLTLAGSVTLPNTFTAGTPARASEVNANFSAIKSAVDDNDARINTLISQGQQPVYRYKNVVGTLTNSAAASPLSIVYFELNITTTDLGGGLFRADLPSVKLIAVDSPAISSLLNAAITKTPITQLILSTTGISVQLDNAIVTELVPAGKEFALPSRYTASSSDPALVSITLSWANNSTSLLTLTDTTAGLAVSYTIFQATVLGCATGISDVLYVQQGSNPAIPPNTWPIYRYELGTNTAISTNGTLGMTTYKPATIIAPLDAGTRDVCLFGAIARGATITRVSVQYTDDTGRLIASKGLTLNSARVAAYRLFSGEAGSPVLAADYGYQSATLQYDASNQVSWDVNLNR